jgi:hypothetical protein
MKKIRIIGMCATLAFAAAPAAVEAQSCSSLRAERNRIDNLGRDMASNNPGSALVTAGCLAVGIDEYNRTNSFGSAVGAFALCAGIGCALTGDMSNCMWVGRQLFGYAIQIQSIDQRLRNCY